MTDTSQMAPHVVETRVAATKLHVDHHERSTPVERLLDRVTAALGRPASLAGVVLFVIAWIGVNGLLSTWGYKAFDTPPYPWLEDILTVASLGLGVLILSTQRRAGQLANLREQITLELASLTERKVGKIIELIEELRRDSPEVKNRIDAEAEAMAERSDQHEIIEAVKDSHDKTRISQAEADR